MPDTYRHGPEGIPDDNRTLAPHVIAWVSEWLQQPDGPDAGGPWKYTREQVHFLAWWYAIDDTGRFVYRRSTLRRMKGWGKDPLLATICAVELAGPCRFQKFDNLGFPIAIPHPAPWIQVAAVSKDQTRNTMTLFPRIFSQRAIAEFKLDIGKEIIYTGAGGRIEAVTSAPASLEGGRPSLVVKNENQHWNSSNDGHNMSQVIDRNLAKSRDGAARAIAITNAHEPGRDSDAERDWEAYQKMQQGRTRGRGFLYDSLEAPADTKLEDEASLRRGLMIARGDSYWLDIDRLVEEIYDPKTPADMSRRYYLNQLWAAQDAWIAPEQWNRNASTETIPDAGAVITLGFDGSKSDDWTALLGCRVDDGLLWPVGIWDPADFGGEAPREMIDIAVRTAFEKWDIVGFYSDLHPWESYVDAWNADFSEGLVVKASVRHKIAYDMRSRTKDITFATERFHDAVLEGQAPHTNDGTFNQHIYNARRRPNAYGVAIGKEHRESARKIDAVVSAILARQARSDFLALPETKRRRRHHSGSASFY